MSEDGTRPAPLVAEVHVYSKEAQLAKYEIAHGEYIIGRDQSCHIVCDTEGVSRHHARLSFHAFELLIEDMESSNGVYIEGVQVAIPTRVKPEQEVQIGGARLYIRLNAEARRRFAEALWDVDLGLENVRAVLAGKKYKTVGAIGAGGMGVVNQARDMHIRRTVAMKVMNTKNQFSRENVLRFVDEAQLTGQLEHPNIVPVYELGLDDQGEIFYTMKYVKGITLEDVLVGLRKGDPAMVEKYPIGELLTVFQKVCDAVAYAHAKGVVHRDLKPENIMLGDYGEVLVMDWGLAKNMTGAQRPEGRVETVADEAELLAVSDPRGFQTLHGLIVGTPPFISPEQARGELHKVDQRSDVFVLGAILYAMVTLRPPVEGGTVAEVVENLIAHKITPPLSFNSLPKSSAATRAADPSAQSFDLLHLPGKKVPESLASVIMEAMAHSRANRYQSVEELQDDVTACIGGFAPKAERAGLFKQSLLWAQRHKREVTLFAIFAVLFHIVVYGFFLGLKTQRDAAIANAKLALENEQRTRDALRQMEEAQAELREAAPSFASDAEDLIAEGDFDAALAQVERAIEQQPDNTAFILLRGHILQSQLKLNDANATYQRVLDLEPDNKAARSNLTLCANLLAGLGTDGQLTAAQLHDLQQAMLAQGRADEAFAMLRRISADREIFRRTVTETFTRLGLRDRVQPFDDETVEVNLSGLDLSGRPGGGGKRVLDLRQLRNRPVSSLILDGTRLADISLLSGMKLRALSLSNNPLSELTALTAMPLHRLTADSTNVRDITVLAQLPLEHLSLRHTRVTSLAPLRGSKLEILNLSGCHELRDITPLATLPLQTLDLSRTAVRDLTPLAASPLRELNLEGCADLTDLRPLLSMKNLEAVLLPATAKNIAPLRNHPTLRRISYKKMTQTAAEFWSEQDAR